MLILPASSGVPELADLNEVQRLQLLTILETLEQDIDFLLIDTGAGISANVMYFNMAAQDIVVVVTPEPTSITDAYALMKVLCTKYDEKHFKVIMNNVAHAKEAKEAFRRLHLVISFALFSQQGDHNLRPRATATATLVRCVYSPQQTLFRGDHDRGHLPRFVIWKLCDGLISRELHRSFLA